MVCSLATVHEAGERLLGYGDATIVRGGGKECSRRIYTTNINVHSMYLTRGYRRSTVPSSTVTSICGSPAAGESGSAVVILTSTLRLEAFLTILALGQSPDVLNVH